jgi:hypothetical protein
VLALFAPSRRGLTGVGGRCTRTIVMLRPAERKTLRPPAAGALEIGRPRLTGQP